MSTHRLNLHHGHVVFVDHGVSPSPTTGWHVCVEALLVPRSFARSIEFVIFASTTSFFGNRLS